MYRATAPRFRKNMMALAIGTALAPSGAWALDLVQSPPLPSTKSAFVAPNVIISIDDSKNMNWTVAKDVDGLERDAPGYNRPFNDGTWATDAKRINILKYYVKDVFGNKETIPDGKIRIAWQSFNNSIPLGANITTQSMRPLVEKINPNDTETDVHRKNFINFVNSVTPNGAPQVQKIFTDADKYMRLSLSSNGPWSSNPGGSDAKSREYLGCRRHYHIAMSTGKWSSINEQSGRDNMDNVSITLPDGKNYNTSSDQTNVYRSADNNNISDWAFQSWSQPLQSSGLLHADKITPSMEYQMAPNSETFKSTNNLTTRKYKINNTCKTPTDACAIIASTNELQKTVSLEKYWNPKYNPATWPHMVTYTIGFGIPVDDNKLVKFPDPVIDFEIKTNPNENWEGKSDIKAPDITFPFSFNNQATASTNSHLGNFSDLVTGLRTWPKMKPDNGQLSLDLWHASINGRGRFYAVTKAEDLAKAFSEIIAKIQKDNIRFPDKILSGGGTTGYSVTQNNAGLFSTVYEAKKNWKGYVMATSARQPEEYPCPTADDPEKKCLKFPDPVAGWKEGDTPQTTADRLDALSTTYVKENRVILTWGDTAAKGVPFKWASDESNLSASQKSKLGVESDAADATVQTKGENVLNFIRGDKTLQGTTEALPFRERESRQGDIVNSQIWYTGAPVSSYGLSGYSSFANTWKNRSPMLYVGGNDGMLHGFSATDGREKLAYVPRGVIPTLKELADPNYQHRYYVDGSPMTGDIQDGTEWKTLLVGTLGAGGKGYFVLNVTNPANFTEANANTLVQLDRTRGSNEAAPVCSTLTGTTQTSCEARVEEDKDIGNITAQPTRNPANLQEAMQITRMNNGRWAVLMGNGYNSTNQRPVLLVQYLDQGQELVRIQTTTHATGSGMAQDNGLASPSLIDLNGDGTVDVAYAGDNLGNLWKFDLTSDSASQWAVQFGTNIPLFTARGPKTLGAARSEIQPITAPPITRPNDRMMTIGSGTSAKDVAVGGMMVAFGTGRNLTANDRRTDITQNVQTLYSVLDNTRYRKRQNSNLLEVHPGAGDCTTAPQTCVPVPAPVGQIGSNGAPLAKQEISAVQGDYATVNAVNALDKTSWKDYKGWYLDLPGAGERALKPLQFYDGSNILAFYSESPSGTKSDTSKTVESCVDEQIETSASSQSRTLINIMDGKRPSVQLVDMNGDGVFDAGDKNVSRSTVGSGTVTLITKGNQVLDYTGVSSTGKPEVLARMPEQSVRPTWRQLN